jgi:act minimal PKS acyl carrier protein
MSGKEISLEDLKRILHECAGVDEGVDMTGEILDTGFDDLGYDSLALLETASRITRDYDIAVDHDAISAVTTPRGFLAVVNGG